MLELLSFSKKFYLSRYTRTVFRIYLRLQLAYIFPLLNLVKAILTDVYTLLFGEIIYFKVARLEFLCLLLLMMLILIYIKNSRI
jgi:hypothetical protein